MPLPDEGAADCCGSKDEEQQFFLQLK